MPTVVRVLALFHGDQTAGVATVGGWVARRVEANPLDERRMDDARAAAQVVQVARRVAVDEEPRALGGGAADDIVPEAEPRPCDARQRRDDPRRVAESAGDLGQLVVAEGDFGGRLLAPVLGHDGLELRVGLGVQVDSALGRGARCALGDGYAFDGERLAALLLLVVGRDDGYLELAWGQPFQDERTFLVGDSRPRSRSW